MNDDDAVCLMFYWRGGGSTWARVTRRMASDAIKQFYEVNEAFSKHGWLARALAYWRSRFLPIMIAFNAPDGKDGIYSSFAIDMRGITCLCIAELDKTREQQTELARRQVEVQSKVAKILERKVDEHQRGEDWRDGGESE